MPKLGLTMVEGVIGEWFHKEGDHISKGDSLFSVETYKMTNEIEAEEDGVLIRILAKAGDTLPCTAIIGYLGAEGETVDAPSSSMSKVETITEEVDRHERTTSHNPTNTPYENGYILASPAAKHLARERGISLEKINTSSKNGCIFLSDVESAKNSSVKSSPVAAKMAAELKLDLVKIPSNGRIMKDDVSSYAAESKLMVENTDENEELVPMSIMRKVIATRMSESHSVAPTVTYHTSVNMTAMKALKSDLSNYDIKVSFSDLIVFVVSRVLTEFPMVNCSVEGTNLRLKKYVNIGLAVAVPNGLLVPVLRNVDKMNLHQISVCARELARKAKEGTLSTDELAGGTFTITNLGMYGIESFNPIINQPEVAILGVNAIKDTVIPEGNNFVVKPMMMLSLTADHRAIDGAAAAQFLSRVQELLEAPGLLFVGKRES
jgi:pyruvate dehydrogenase E2 component (dihydrolipoamide acetyltransferase)